MSTETPSLIVKLIARKYALKVINNEFSRDCDTYVVMTIDGAFYRAGLAPSGIKFATVCTKYDAKQIARSFEGATFVHVKDALDAAIAKIDAEIGEL